MLLNCLVVEVVVVKKGVYALEAGCWSKLESLRPRDGREEKEEEEEQVRWRETCICYYTLHLPCAL